MDRLGYFRGTLEGRKSAYNAVLDLIGEFDDVDVVVYGGVSEYLKAMLNIRLGTVEALIEEEKGEANVGR